MYVCAVKKMKIMRLLHILDNMILLLTSLFSGADVGGVNNRPIYNQDFIDKFVTVEDRKKLERKIEELKNDETTNTGEIELSSSEKITIVVN